MNIFLLEDDVETSNLIVQGLRDRGHQVETAHEGDLAARRLAVAVAAFDVLVLDREAPGLDGLSLMRAVRACGCATPILLLSESPDVEDRVAGLEAGADDYLSKPFAFIELAARIAALGRRSLSQGAMAILRVGDVEMDLVRREVRRGGQPVELQPREFTLLEHLMRHPGRTVTRAMLLDRVWNFGFDPKTNIVETHMSRLRGKLDRGFQRAAIRTVRGAGYMMDDPSA